MKCRMLLVSVGLMVSVLGGSQLWGESSVDFQRDIQSIFEEKCLSCHKADLPQSGLVLESIDSILQGGEKAGASIIAGDSGNSPLIHYLRGQIEPRMPMGGDPLPEDQINLIAQWIDQLRQPMAESRRDHDASAHYFDANVRSLLEQNCFSCHNAQTHQSGLVLETQASIMKGGAIQGPAIIAGKSDQSPLIQRLRGTREPKMPMKGQPLSEEQIGRIARWIDQLNPSSAIVDNRSSRKLGWPWTPVTKLEIPVVKNTEWVNNPIDAFILAKLEQRELEPARAVSKRGLLRRLYFGLIGLPPTPEEMEQFLTNPSPKVYKQEVEKLLRDSRYGEHWGRHWLDLARYSDTRGGAIDYPQIHMWRYRDYVIRAFNQDRPYDRFIKEQLAGDAFRNYGNEGKLGLGFLGLWVQVEAEGEQARRNFITDVVNTTGSVFLGLTLGCAHCHDHKYDPLPQKDYARIEAFFSPMSFDKQDLPFHQYELPLQQPERWKRKKNQWKEQLAEMDKKISEFRTELKNREVAYQVLRAPQDLKDWVEEGQRKLLEPSDTLLTQEDKDRLALIRLQKGRFANPVVPGYYEPKAYMVKESPLQHNLATYVLTGGNWRLKAEQVQPGFLSAITGNSDPVNLDGLRGSRRKLLAQWITRRDHPLTARVMVNRIWQYHFGKGLVSTPSDFGDNGGGTVHQDLIDWLAWQFMENGWSVKKIHRLILNSNVYQQAMTHPRSEAYEKVDPDNRYLWVRDPVRIEAESLRDSLLAVSGQLNPEAGGPPFFPEENLEQMARAETWWDPSDSKELKRRSIYMIQSRSYPIPMIKVFDGPNLDESCVVRGNTTVTPQVFTLFNGKFSHEQSQIMAERILTEVGTDPVKQIERAFQLAFQRLPSKAEKETSMAFLAEPKAVLKKPHNFSLRRVGLVQNAERGISGVDRIRSLSDLCLVLINMNEFVFLE